MALTSRWGGPNVLCERGMCGFQTVCGLRQGRKPEGRAQMNCGACCILL